MHFCDVKGDGQLSPIFLLLHFQYQFIFKQRYILCDVIDRDRWRGFVSQHAGNKEPWQDWGNDVCGYVFL